jgi:hypothetical protein
MWISSFSSTFFLGEAVFSPGQIWLSCQNQMAEEDGFISGSSVLLH